MGSADDSIGFAERLMQLLDRGAFTSTYKYAVLLGMIDVCLEHTDKHGDPPAAITTRQLAEKVLELYWPHAVPFVDDAVLLQSHPTKGRRVQAEIVSLIATFRHRHAPDPYASLARSRAAAPKPFHRLVCDVEWKLVQMPLPRLQRVGTTTDSFLYRVAWDTTVTRRAFEQDTDNQIHFRDGASQHMVRLAGLLRPLLRREWSALVARINPDLVGEAKLDEFLFGVDRIDSSTVRGALIDLQQGCCFYCGRTLRRDAQVDHFIPWSRVPNNAIENLVVADPGCNGSKSDHLASVVHLRAWHERLALRGEDLRARARAVAWESRRAETMSLVRGVYLRLPPQIRLWCAGQGLVTAAIAEVREVFAA